MTGVETSVVWESLDALKADMHKAARAFQARWSIPEQDFEDVYQEAVTWALAGPAWIAETLWSDPADDLASAALGHLQLTFPEGKV